MAKDEMLHHLVEEIQDMLPTWESVCLEMERNPQFDNYDEMFRMAHNIKGTAKMFNLEKFGDFIHQVEDLITLLNGKAQKKDKRHVEIFLETHSLITEWLSKVSEDAAFMPNIAPVLAKIQMLTNSQPNNKIILITEDLVFATLPKIMEKYFSPPGAASTEKMLVKIAAQNIDTAGIQLILSLSKTPQVQVDCTAAGPSLGAAIKTLGLEGKISGPLNHTNISA